MLTSKGIMDVANILIGGISAGLEVFAVAKAAQETLDKMLKEGRDPTKEELDEVLRRIKERSERIQNG